MRLRDGIRAGDELAELLPALVQPENATVAFARLAELGDARALRYLTPFLVASSAKVRRLAELAVSGLMPRRAAELVHLEAKVRERHEYPSDAWWPSGVPRLDYSAPPPATRSAIEGGCGVSTLGLLSFNANGHTRELVTRALAEKPGTDAIAFLLLRVNDWVPQVARVARDAILGRCVPHAAHDFVAALPLVERLGTQRRGDHSAVVAAIAALLTRTDAGISAMASALQSATDRDVRRAIVRLLRSQPVSLAPFEAGLADGDPVVRTQLVIAWLERAEPSELTRRLPQLLADGSARVRALAYHAAEAKAPQVLQAALHTLLFDSNFWLREYARQKLKLPKPAAAKLYASAIAEEDARLIPALAGLGESGAAEDASILLEHTRYGSSGNQQVALRALFNVLHAQAVPTLIEALASDWAGVSKVAAELLRSRGLIVFAEDVAVCLGDPAPFTRANALRVLAKIDRWEALIGALSCALDPDSRVATAADRILSSWRYVPASFGSPPRARQRERLLVALAAAPQNLAQIDRVRVTVAAML